MHETSGWYWNILINYAYTNAKYNDQIFVIYMYAELSFVPHVVLWFLLLHLLQM